MQKMEGNIRLKARKQFLITWFSVKTSRSVPGFPGSFIKFFWPVAKLNIHDL